MSSANSYVMERRSPKSPMAVAKSPVPRSPMPKSPIPKSPVPYDKYKSRCAYGLLGFFHFRRSNSKKLISDRRHLHRHAVGNVHKKNRFDVFSDYDDRCQHTDQAGKRISTAKSQCAVDLCRNSTKATKTSRRSRRLPIYGCYDVSAVGHGRHGGQVTVTSKKLVETAATVEVLSSEVNPGSATDCDHKSISLQLHMDEETEAFINQKLIDGEQGSPNQSKHFLDALQILNSNRDLFVKLLQDPNSLLVKHIEDLRDSRTKEQEIKSFTENKLLEERSSNRREYNGSGNPQVLDKIVVLQPGSMSLQEGVNGISHDSSLVPHRFRKVEQSVKPRFFPFKLMRRKLMNAMGVNRKTDGIVRKLTYDTRGIEKYGEQKWMENNGRNSPKKASMDVKRIDQNKVENLEPVVGDKVASAGESGIENNYDTDVESRKLTELLNKGNEKFLRKQRPKTWDGLGFAPEYDFLSMLSPGRKRENGFLTPQVRFSRYGSYQNDGWYLREKETICLSPLRQNAEVLRRPDTENSCDHLHMPDTKPSISVSDKGPRDAKDSNISAEIGPVVASEMDQNDTSYNDSSQKSHLLPSSIDDCPSSPVSIKRVEDFDSIADKAEQPSPVSVLEQFFSEDITSPSRTESQPAESSILPLPICMEEDSVATLVESPVDLNTSSSSFAEENAKKDYLTVLAHVYMDPKINSSSNAEEQASMLEYINTVLHSCGLSWDELMLKCHSSDQFLDQTLFDEVDDCSKTFNGDHGLLFDYVTEVLLEVYQYYLRHFTSLQFTKPKILSTTMTRNIVREVKKHIDWSLLLSEPNSQTLDQISEKDLKKSVTWMDVRNDAEEIVGIVVESVIEDIIIETAMEW